MGLFKRNTRSDTVALSAEGPLSAWQPGQEGVITEVPGSSRLASRLREMGVVPGVRVRVLRTGRALVVQVGEGRLCLRRKDAIAIRVSLPQPQPAQSPSLALRAAAGG